MGFSRQEYCSGLPFLLLGDLLNTGIETASPVSPALHVDSLALSHQGSPQIILIISSNIFSTFLSSGIPNYDISTTDTNPQLTGALFTVTFSVF